MTDLAISLSLSLVEQIIGFTTHLSYEQKIQGNVTTDIGDVKGHLKTIEAFVQSGKMSPMVEEAIVQAVRDVAYRIEDVLDGIMLHEPHYSPNSKLVRKPYEWWHNSWHKGPLLEIHDEIQKIRCKIREIQKYLALPHEASSNSSTELQHHLLVTLEDDIIPGNEVSKEKLVSQLINAEERNCSVVVVVGPPGSGKTVLANSVYSSRQVSRRFSCKIGVRVSRYFDVNSLLHLLFSQTQNGEVSLTGDSATKLKNYLRGKRYLILLDDVWSENHWRHIKLALPDDSNGSRIFITTTKKDVATSIATSPKHIHLVEGLKEEDSWKLFCSKAFPEENGVCHPDLMNLSKKIMRKCEGSSLAISAVGSLLAPKQKLPSEWTKVLDNLRAEMECNSQFSDLNNSMLQSYDDLHGNLKSCLLYFSLFPEGCEIERARLLRLWVAERFVNETGEKSAEEVAEEYLNELISRHLVVADKDFDGRVNKCRVRNFLYYFLTVKSRKENFAATLDKPSTKPEMHVHRLTVADAFSNGGRLRGLKLRRVNTSIMSGDVSLPQIKDVWDSFKYLKVLEIQGERLQEFPECVINLELLRYLSLRGSRHIFKVPRSIKKLRYLEFLDLKKTCVTYLPTEICLLHNLQHLLVYHYRPGAYVTFDTAQGMKMTRGIGSLNSLRKLTLLKAENHWKFFDLLGNLTQLQKLGLIELRRSYGRSLCESLAKMKHLSVLDLRSVGKSEYLDLDYPLFNWNVLQRVYLKGPLEKLPVWIKSLKSLVRIHLRWSRLTTSPIDELQGLNNLIELHLADAFTGDTIEFRKDAFENLKILKLEELTELSTVKVHRGSMRNLQSLTLCNCGQLKTLPSRIQRLSELKELLLFDMPFELTNKLHNGGLDHLKYKVYSSDAAKQKWFEQHIPNLMELEMIDVFIENILFFDTGGFPKRKIMCVKARDHIHIVEGLQEEDSWQLFCRKAFRDEQGVCPPDLMELSRKILLKCEGSSLAISAVGGLLAPKHRWPAEWTKVHENLRAETESNSQFSDLNNSMLQGYDDLHCNLKSCLLYFSLFPEGCYIERARLIRLWLAERFVNETGGKPAEELAEEYLNELIKRHLVVACKDFDGRVKNCRVRNFLLYFLIAKSRKEDFSSILDKTSAKPGENVRRLSVVDALSGVGIMQLQTKHVCTGIIMSGKVFEINELCNQLKYLKVLDFQGAPLQNFPECVTDLELLRYLSLRGSRHIFRVPGSIKKLRYLEFLDLKHTLVTCLPKEICLLHNLRHLLVYHYRLGTYVTFETAQGMKMTREIGNLNSLRKLTLLKAENHWKFFDQLGKLTQLQKLGLIELRKTDGMYLCKSLANMMHLSVLDLRSMNKSEYLDLDYPSLPCSLLQRVYLKGPLQKLPSWIQSLRSLVRIHLRWSRLTTSPLDELQGLNTLIELHLDDAFIGNKLKFATDAFENLKVLRLEALAELSIMKVSRGSLRNLQSLTLRNCGQLKTLPSHIQRHSLLKELVLFDMPVELTNNLCEGGMDCSKIKVDCSDAA